MLQSHVYLGPYVLCRTTLVQVERQVLACSNPQCVRHQANLNPDAAQFCAVCGQRIALCSFLVATQTPVAWEVQEGPLGDALQHVNGLQLNRLGVHFWLPNQHRRPALRRYLYHTRHDTVALAITEEQRALEVQHFQEDFAGELAQLLVVYGQAAVDWGLLCWQD